MSGSVCITGCSRGLGRALAVEFADRGWKVAGGARSKGCIEELKAELGPGSHLQILDVSVPEQVDSFAIATMERIGSPDLLVNNAGMINANAKLKDVSAGEFAQVLNTNLGGIHNMIRAFLPAMEKRGRGIIVNFSSYWGRSTAPEVGPYCASKWGVEGLTRSLAQELPAGLGTVAFNPGVIHTDMLRSCFGEEAKNYEDPTFWAKRATKCLVGLSPDQNGETIVP
ncbi:MAG TPA: oxidoreductase [Opitutae bacterium]|nr:oxidoreductase [Opitutae bacterium]